MIATPPFQFEAIVIVVFEFSEGFERGVQHSVSWVPPRHLVGYVFSLSPSLPHNSACLCATTSAFQKANPCQRPCDGCRPRAHCSSKCRRLPRPCAPGLCSGRDRSEPVVLLEPCQRLLF